MRILVFYLANFICFFMLNVHANGAQIQNNFNNQILSSIYAEYNSDYLTWKALPRYEGLSKKESSLLNQIIVNEYEYINKIESRGNFTIDLLQSLEQIKNGQCMILENDKANYIFEESLKNSFNFWISN